MVETKINCFRRQNEIHNINWKIQWTEDALHIENDNIFYIFFQKKMSAKGSRAYTKTRKKSTDKRRPVFEYSRILTWKMDREKP